MTAEPWAEALLALAPGLQAFLYPTVGLVFDAVNLGGGYTTYRLWQPSKA